MILRLLYVRPQSSGGVFLTVQLFMAITSLTACLLLASMLGHYRGCQKPFEHALGCGFSLFRVTHCLCLYQMSRKSLGFFSLFHTTEKNESQPNSFLTMMILFGCLKQHKVFSNCRTVKRNPVMTGDVTQYVQPFAVLNKAELAIMSVNIKTELKLKSMQINPYCSPGVTNYKTPGCTRMSQFLAAS